MIADRWPEVSRVLDQVLDRPPAEWPDLVARLCAGDESLRHEVEAVLAGHGRIDGFLETPPHALAAEALHGSEDLTGTMIGPYRVVRLIARGGMGRVLLAERADGAFTQRVALKLLGAGADTPDAAWRFRTERHILATLVHPNISHLHDGGVSDDGRQWLAMEYVEGVTIDRYVEAHDLSVRRRLELFLTVAGAVQYAHGKLVIHRDLKAGNIMVTASGQPKLLDFGIAKLLVDDADGSSLHRTRTGQRWMTPAYAAPEQVLGEPATTATDVYQLGAVLYELLTGRPPFEPERANVRAIEDAVLTKDPVRPSQMVASRPSPEAWARALRGDLDAIVLKALRKEPERRYGSVEAMADDVRRYLARQPVLARAGTLGYRTRRFVTRHRVGVGVAAGFAALLLASAVALAVEQAATARERDRAAAEAAKSAQVTDYLMGLFEASDPGQALGDSVTARALLERGVARADALTGQPAVQAALLGITGKVYVNLGEHDRGQALLERSVAIQRASADPDERQLTRTLLDLASTLEAKGAYARATELYREVVRRAARDPRDRSLQVNAQFGVASTLHARHDMAAANSAFAVWESMLDSLPAIATPELANSQVWLGQMLQYRSEHPRAERMLRRAVATNRAVYGDGHPQVGDALNALASALLSARARVEAADSVTEEALTLQRRLGTEPRRALVNAMANRAELLEAGGAYSDAERMARDAQAMAGTLFGEEHLLWGRLAARLANVLHLQGKNGEAAELYRRLYASWVERRGPDYLFTVIMAVRLAEVLAAEGDFPEAERLMLASYETFRRDRGDDDVWTSSTAQRLDGLYRAWGKPEQAALYADRHAPGGSEDG